MCYHTTHPTHIGLLLKESAECKSSAANALAALLIEQAQPQAEFCKSQGVGQLLGMVQSQDIAVVIAACRLLQSLAPCTALYGALDATSVAAALLRRVQHANVGVSAAAAAGLAAMLPTSGAVRESAVAQVGMLVDLVTAPKSTGRSGALHVLCMLSSVDVDVRTQLASNKVLIKSLLKGADMYKKGSVDFESCARLYLMLTGAAQ